MKAIKKEGRYWLEQGFSLILSDTWNEHKKIMTEYADIVEGGFSFKFNADFQVVQMILLYLYFREMAYY